MTAWAHLPNAKHIDAVLAHVRSRPGRWDAAQSAAQNAAQDAAQNAAQDAARGAAWDAAQGAARLTVRDATQNAARDAAWDVAWDVARDAIAALVGYDDCAHYLGLTPGAVRVAASAGIPAAVLLLPAVIAMEVKV